MQHQKNKKRKQKKSPKSKSSYTFDPAYGYQPNNSLTKYFEKKILKSED
tara:strand:+ start:697 stop:843 length:147 start_codon:yes stop_codon:yes gene_type:complete